MLGSILGSPDLGKLPYELQSKLRLGGPFGDCIGFWGVPLRDIPHKFSPGLI